ncbi:MAG: hypothetical protein ACKUBY_05930 [Candidatus Moraniibacteriota bacterium]|jgi:hypothetical protein
MLDWFSIAWRFTWKEKILYLFFIPTVIIVSTSYGWHAFCKKMPPEVQANIAMCTTCSMAVAVVDVTDTTTTYVVDTGEKCFQISDELYDDALDIFKSI